MGGSLEDEGHSPHSAIDDGVSEVEGHTRDGCNPTPNSEEINNGSTNKSSHSTQNHSGIRIKINGKWLHLSKEFVANHPGGPVISEYRNADATHVFHAFHEGSTTAYKQLDLLMAAKAGAPSTPIPDDPYPSIIPKSPAPEEEYISKTAAEDAEVDGACVGIYDLTAEQEKEVAANFEKLRQKVHRLGLMEARPLFYARKVAEIASMLIVVFTLQYHGWYIASAAVLALCWQQLGWLCHEFCHHQPFKNRRLNDWFALLFGNIAQGYARDWWKDKHNTHHAATNIIEQDGDIDLAPLIALVPADLLKYREPLERLLLRVIPYQHLYFTFMLPLLRFSWTSQSIVHVVNAPKSHYRKHRRLANWEQLGIALHWLWVLAQLYALPSNGIRLVYFLISQLGGGFLVALVVTYNHNSCVKFPKNSPLLNNFAALHLLTTRNMQPSMLTDWFWGGLNYQIEHHLFPTMPRPNLNRCSVLVKQFCAENNLPYMVDNYWDGYAESLKLLQEVSALAKTA